VNHWRVTDWTAAQVVLPLLPLGLLSLFRWLSPAAPKSPWWVWLWSSELPFFAIILSVTAYVRCQVYLAQNAGQTKPPIIIVYVRWLSAIAAMLAFVVLVFINLDQTKFVEFAGVVQEKLTLMSIGSGVAALVSGVVAYAYTHDTSKTGAP